MRPPWWQQQQSGCEGLKTAATSRSLGNRGHTRIPLTSLSISSDGMLGPLGVTSSTFDAAGFDGSCGCAFGCGCGCGLGGGAASSSYGKRVHVTQSHITVYVPSYTMINNTV